MSQLLVSEVGRLECQALLREHGVEECVEKTKSNMKRDNPVLHRFIYRALTLGPEETDELTLDPQIVDDAIWIGVAVTYVALGSDMPGIPILGPSTLGTISRRYPKGENLSRHYREVYERNLEIDSLLETLPPSYTSDEIVRRHMNISAGFVMFYLEEQHLQELAARWN